MPQSPLAPDYQDFLYIEIKTGESWVKLARPAIEAVSSCDFLGSHLFQKFF
jgi:hypothetical protein